MCSLVRVSTVENISSSMCGLASISYMPWGYLLHVRTELIVLFCCFCVQALAISLGMRVNIYLSWLAGYDLINPTVLSTTFGKSFFRLVLFHRRSKFANVCYDLMQNHLSYLLMHKKLYSSHCFLKTQMFSLFRIVKMNANYAETGRVGNLEANIQQVPFAQFFWNVHIFVAKHQ